MAPRIPKIAPDAPTVTESGVRTKRARRPCETRDEVESEEARPAEVPLDGRADHPEDEHVEADVKDARVQELPR